MEQKSLHIYIIYVEKQVNKALQRVLITKLYAGMKRPNFELFFDGILFHFKCSNV